MTVQSVPSFFSQTRSSLCLFSVVHPPFLPMPLRLGYSWNRILSKHAWQVKEELLMSNNWFAIHSQCTNILLSASSWSEEWISSLFNVLVTFTADPSCNARMTVRPSLSCPGRFSDQSESRNVNNLDLLFHWTNNVWDWLAHNFVSLLWIFISMAVHWDCLDLSPDFIEFSTSYQSGAIWTWLLQCHVWWDRIERWLGRQCWNSLGTILSELLKCCWGDLLQNLHIR